MAGPLTGHGLHYIGVDSSEQMVEAGRRRHPGVEFVAVAQEEYEPREPVDATLCLRAFYYPEDRVAFFRKVAGYTKVKFVFDFRQAEHAAESVLADVRAAGFSKIELRPFFTPQRRALPRVALSVLGLLERTGPLALWLSKRFGRVFCSASWFAARLRRRLACVRRGLRIRRARARHVARRAARAAPGRGGPVHDRGRAGRFPRTARLAHERRRARQVRLPLRGAGGVGPVPPARRPCLPVRGGAALLASLLIAAIAPFADSIFAHGAGLEKPLLVAALLPPLQALESIAAATLILNGRYDLRGIWLTISIAMRLTGIWIGREERRHGGGRRRGGGAGADHGVDPRDLVPRPAHLPARRAAATRRRSRADHPVRRPERRVHGVDLAPDVVAPLTLGIVRSSRAVGLFRAAQLPMTGLNAASSPLRMILLSEQTRDWEHGRPDVVLRGIRRYVKGSAGAAALALIPAWGS